MAHRKPFAANLRALRERYNLSQAQAADMIGIPMKRYQSYEGNTEPPLDGVIKILQAFNITDPIRFMTGKETPKPVSPFERKFNQLDPKSKKAVEVLMGLG